MFDPCDLEVMGEISFHVLSGDSLQVAACHDAEGKRQGSTVQERVDQIVLTGQDNGQKRFVREIAGKRKGPRNLRNPLNSLEPATRIEPSTC